MYYFTHYYQPKQCTTGKCILCLYLYVVKSVHFGKTVVMCFSFLSPASWLVSALHTTTEMRIKQSSSAWSPRSCTISHTAQTASPVKRPRWGWQNPFTVSSALFPRAQTEIVTYAHIVRKYPTALLFGWSHGITVLKELINHQIKCVHAWVFCFHACRAHWGCGNSFFCFFCISWWGIIYISLKLIIRSLLNAEGSGAPSLPESLLLMLNLMHAVCLYSCLLESPAVISSAHLVRFLIADDGKPA